MPTIKAQMTEIQEMDLSALRDVWRHHFRASPPPRFSRDLLIRGIVYKLQEKTHGGLSKATRRRRRTPGPNPSPRLAALPQRAAPKCASAHGWCANGKAGPMPLR